MRKIILVIIVLLSNLALKAQYYDEDTLRINNYIINLYEAEEGLRNSVDYYENQLGVSGLNFERIEPEYPDTDVPENWINKKTADQESIFYLTIREGEWSPSFSVFDPQFIVSLGSRQFNIGESKSSVLSKLDAGYKLVKDDDPSYIFVFCGDAIVYFNFYNGNNLTDISMENF